MVFLSNSPVEDAAGGEADKSLRFPCGMHAQWKCNTYFIEAKPISLGYAQKATRRWADKSSEYQPYACGSKGILAI